MLHCAEAPMAGRFKKENMNRRTSKLIHKTAIASGAAGDELKHSEKDLKATWNKMPAPERAEKRKDMEKALTAKES
jgi:hypothetical protein